MPIQDEVFATSEGDSWYKRNRQALQTFNPAADLPLRILELYGVRPKRVVEVGGSNGYRMAAMAQRFGAEATVIEPSKQAVEEGRKLFPQVRYVNATAANAPIAETFDLVVVNYVFHWIDRATLLASAAAVDRLVAEPGLLLLGDFCSSNRLRVPYHHLRGEVHTYKQDYSQLFLATGCYQTVCMLTGDHGSSSSPEPKFAVAAESDRIAHWLLRKSRADYYIDAPLPSL